MAELKVTLKEAKNAIKEKEFQNAMTHCKAALKVDRKNYQALVMFGKVCQELNKFEDSKKSLLLATQIEPDQPVAWQGLSTLHEKEPKVFTEDEAICLLSHLLDIVTEEEKYELIARRLAAVHQENGSMINAVNVLKNLIRKLSNTDKKIQIWKSIVLLLSNIKEASPEISFALIEALENCLNDSPLGENETNYQLYLKTLYKSQSVLKLVLGAEKMFQVFPTAYPLEWIARIFVEVRSSILHDKDEFTFNEIPIEDYIDKLLLLYNKSPWGYLAQGLILMNKGDFFDARTAFRKGVNLLPSNILAWSLLLDVQKNLNENPGIEAACKKILFLLNDCTQMERSLKNLPKWAGDFKSFKQSLMMTQVHALFKMGHKNHLNQALDILKKEPEKEFEGYMMIIKILIKLEEYDTAEEYLDSISLPDGQRYLVQLLRALIIEERGDIQLALQIHLQIIQEMPSCSEALLALGRLYYTSGSRQKALIFLLKAAKLNPNLSSAFLFLGHYYKSQNNLDKAKKCYEKALNLNSWEEDAGAGLSDVYRLTGDHESNLALLTKVTSVVGRSRCGWAWLRLGLHHIAQGNYEEAIRSHQCTVEINPHDSLGYECLGDAYLARGSFTAALKVFTKAAELNITADYYPRCQIARIKYLIGDHLSSISDYESVLEGEPPESVKVVALVGLSEALLTRAKKYTDVYLFENLKGDCLHAMKCLCEVASKKPNNLTIWKLLGDACCLMVSLPPSLCFFDVPQRLLNSDVSSLEVTETLDKRQLLELGSRCYAVGTRMDKTNDSLWHDLGTSLFLQGWSLLHITKGIKEKFDENEDKDTIMDLMERSLSCLKESIKLQPSNANTWNSLGVVAFFKGDNALAQHAFIKSLNISPTASAWTHLGVLYLKEDIHLAHEAFSQAQAQDPSFVACWVGQALIAELVGHFEAFDLFRHTTILGINVESCIGHGHYVLQMICETETKKDEDSSKKNVSPFLPVVSDCLQFYTREKEDDVIGQNMCGLILEMMGLHHGAIIAFKKAVEVAENLTKLPLNIKDSLHFNYARNLMILGRLEESIEQYSKIKEPDFYTQCNLALTKLKAGAYEEAYEGYSSAIYWLAPNTLQKSHALVALAFLQYKFRKIEDVKTLLFQSSCSDSSGGKNSVEGLLALTALGLLEGDYTLTDAALTELKPYIDMKEFVPQVAFLMAAQATLKGDFHSAKLILCRAIHRHPECASLWRYLSQLLLTRGSSKIAAAAAVSASAARILSQSSSVIDDNKNVKEDVITRALAHMKGSISASKVECPEPSKKRGKKQADPFTNKVDPPDVKNKPSSKASYLLEAQRAVLMCPGDPETWCVLIAALKDKKKQQALDLSKPWIAKCKPVLSQWLQSTLIV